MRRCASAVALSLTFAASFIGIIAILGAPEFAYYYSRNGHSLNPMRYTSVLPKINFKHPFWHGRYSYRS